MLSTAEKWYSDSQTKLKPHAEKEKRARADARRDKLTKISR